MKAVPFVAGGLLALLVFALSGDSGGVWVDGSPDAETSPPLPSMSRVSSWYGYRTDPITKQQGAFHHGIDFPAPTGTPVFSCRPGRVARIDRGHKSNGNAVLVLDDEGLTWCYLHLDRIRPGLAVGDGVNAGFQLGTVGSTGRSTGPHLHLQIYRAGQTVDPAPYLGLQSGRNS